MSKIKNGGLDQYGAEPFEQQQFGTASIKEVNINITSGWQNVRLPVSEKSIMHYQWFCAGRDTEPFARQK